jgi:glutaredoxin 3
MTCSQRIISAALVALCCFFLQSLLGCSSFTAFSTTLHGTNNQQLHRSSPRLASTATDGDGGSFLDTVTKTYDNFQKARSDGYDFKQSTAIAIAGEYDADAVKTQIQEQIKSAPCVMFTWEASPACKKAIKYLDVAGAKYKIVRLDDPWEEGNPFRSELGKMVGRSSVPCIFIGGEYVGGFDGGVGDESPGILEMAFKGTLREKLMAVGALDA